MSHSSRALRIILVYVLLASLWILVSDQVVAAVATNAALHTILQSIKGELFVAVTALALFGLIVWQFRAREEAEARRHSAESRLKLLEAAVEQTLDAIMITDAQLDEPGPRIVYVNPAFTAMTGYSAEEVIGKTPHTLQGPRTDRAVLDRLRKDLLEGRPFYGEAINYRKDGSEFLCEWNVVPIRDKEGQITHFVAVQRDFTARRRAEEQIRYQANLLQNVSDAIISTDMNLSIKTWNKAATVTYGWREDEVVGKPASEVLQTEFPNASSDEVWRLLLQNGYWKGEVIQRRKDGSALTILGSTTLIRDSAGNPTGIVSVNRDITRDKQIEAELLEAELLRVKVEEERELLELKERFISMVSHEFRTPLTVIVSSSDLLERYFERLPPERRLDHLHKIRLQTDYMRNLLDDVLTFSKGKAGKIDFKPAPLHLEAFCRSLVEQMQSTDEAGHPVAFTVEGDLSEACMDARLLQHIVVNLLSNAIKYSPPGSEVRCELMKDGDDAVLRVSDQGIGIPKADQARLFEPFHRAGNVRHVSGTGLGLAIVKNSVDLHGGQITYESQEGTGTTFTVRLPLLNKMPAR